MNTKDERNAYIMKLTEKYTVIIPALPTPSEKKAAEELCAYLKKITGKVFETADDSKAPAEKEIVLGKTNRIAFDFSPLGDDGFVIKAIGDKLFILGGKRGVLYGVYSFLEEYLGCRYYAKDVEKVPENAEPEVTVNGENRQIPVFTYRNTFWTPNFHKDISVKLKSNGQPHRETLSEEVGGEVGYAGSFVHTLGTLSEQGNGVTETPCLCDEAVFENVVKNCRIWLKDNPQASIISVSQNDVRKGCSCAKCKAIDDREGSAIGSLLEFVNRVADELKKDFPNVMVDTLSYLYTRAVPKTIRARDNVIIRLCSIESCFSHPLNECDAEFIKAPGGRFSDVLKGWSSYCNHLNIWDYTTNFSNYLAPFPNFAVLRQNARFFAENNVTGVLEQGNYQSENAEFGELRAYLLSKLLWNPYMSEAEYYAHMTDFCDGYYGKGGKYIREYIDLIQNEVKDVHFSIYSDPLAIIPVKYVENPGYVPIKPEISEKTDWLAYADGEKAIDMTFLNKAKELFDNAEAEADDGARERIRRSRIQILYYEEELLNKKYGEGMVENITKAVDEKDLQESLKLASAQRVEALRVYNKRLCNELKKYGIQMINEGKKLPENPILENQPRSW